MIEMSRTENNINILSNRNYLFDNMKALLIFSVVLAHYLRASATFDVSTTGGVIYITSFSFIMQGFLFVSGYFSKNVEKCRKTAFKTFLLPYVVLMPLMFAFRYLIFGHATFNIIKPTMALWYLLTLFFYRFFLKDLVKFKHILPVSMVLSFLAGCIPFLNLYLSLGRTFGFLPFFLLGYYCKEAHIERIRSMPKLIGIIILAGLLSFSLFMSTNKVFPLSAWYFKSPYESIGLSDVEGVGARIILTIVAALWILAFINLMPKKKTWLVTVGQHTMSIYVLHIFVRYIIKGTGIFSGQDVFSYLMMIGLAAFTTWLFSRKRVADGYQGIMDKIHHYLLRFISQ